MTGRNSVHTLPLSRLHGLSETSKIYASTKTLPDFMSTTQNSHFKTKEQIQTVVSNLTSKHGQIDHGLDACVSDCDCLNGGKCVESNSLKHMQKDHVCKCKKGWGGILCDVGKCQQP